jgi:FdhD protein
VHSAKGKSSFGFAEAIRRCRRTTLEEKGIALTYGGSTYAVMMATPAHLQDFGIGFTITEGIVELAEQIASIEVIENDLGMEIRMWLNASRAASLVARRRAMVGSVGCGLCGIESLEQACSAPAIVASRSKFHARDLLNAMGALAPLQRLNQQPHAMHAAAFWERSHGIRLVREDVGRHNALPGRSGVPTCPVRTSPFFSQAASPLRRCRRQR